MAEPYMLLNGEVCKSLGGEDSWCGLSRHECRSDHSHAHNQE